MFLNGFSRPVAKDDSRKLALNNQPDNIETAEAYVGYFPKC